MREWVRGNGEQLETKPITNNPLIQLKELIEGAAEEQPFHPPTLSLFSLHQFVFNKLTAAERAKTN